jgi:hypothetical protein
LRGVKLTVDIVSVNGETQHRECSGKFDGKDNPVKGNNPDADTMALTKKDAQTYEIVYKKDGKKTLPADRGRGGWKDAEHYPNGKRQQMPDGQQHDVLRKTVMRQW